MTPRGVLIRLREFEVNLEMEKDVLSKGGVEIQEEYKSGAFGLLGDIGPPPNTQIRVVSFPAKALALMMPVKEVDVVGDEEFGGGFELSSTTNEP